MSSNEILKQALHHMQLGEFPAAEALCRQAIKRRKDVFNAQRMLADCIYNQGVMHLNFSGLIDEAVTCFKDALKHNPDHVEALNNLGSIADQCGDWMGAVDYFEEAHRRAPKFVSAMRNLVAAYQQLGRLEDADAMLSKLCVTDPANATLYEIKRASNIRKIIPDHAYIDLVREKMSRQLDRSLSSKPAAHSPEILGAPYFYLSYHGHSNKQLHQKIAQAFLHAAPSLAWEAPHVGMTRPQGGKIKLGILSSHLCNHSIGHTTRGLVEHLDKSLIEIVVIHLGTPAKDDMAKAMDAAADQVIVVAGQLQASREKIADLRLDILFYQDIGMEAFSYLLSYSRLARVQATSFGHPDTTGVPNMDYFISSSLYEVEGAQEHYSEKLVLVPNAGTLSYYYKPAQPEMPVSRSEFGLNDSENIYFCPQTLFKLHPDMDAALMKITELDPRARIVMIEPAAIHMRTELEERFSRSGERLARHVTFIKRLPHPEYLRLMKCADVMLDTVHFNGQNTNLEAFSLGVPVVTWPGVLQRERHTLGMYRAMGEDLFSELIATDADDYAAKAVNVATDKSFRDELRMKIETSSYVLYENAGFVREMEALFIQFMRTNDSARM